MQPMTVHESRVENGVKRGKFRNREFTFLFPFKGKINETIRRSFFIFPLSLSFSSKILVISLSTSTTRCFLQGAFPFVQSVIFLLLLSPPSHLLSLSLFTYTRRHITRLPFAKISGLFYIATDGASSFVFRSFSCVFFLSLSLRYLSLCMQL